MLCKSSLRTLAPTLAFFVSVTNALVAPRSPTFFPFSFPFFGGGGERGHHHHDGNPGFGAGNGGGNQGSSSVCSNGQSTQNQVCCVWYDVLQDVQANLFSGGQCDDFAHDSLRLTFHDGIGFSFALTAQGLWGGGGADGSIIEHSDVEMSWGVNEGLELIVEEQRKIADTWGVSYGDIIQFAGAVSVRNCAGGPKIQFLAGRSKDTQAAPPNLVPEAFDSVDTILARMADAGFSANDLVDLMASHSIGFQEHVDTTVPGTPFDTTPQELDSQFFLETMLRGTINIGGQNTLNPGEALSPIPGEFRLQSDFLLARDGRTSCRWQEWAAEEANMQAAFATAMAKLAITGQDVSQLADCSEVIPNAQPYTPRLPHLPPQKSFFDIEFSCPATKKLGNGNNRGWQTLPGPLQRIPTIYSQPGFLRTVVQATTKGSGGIWDWISSLFN
ncbi:fungal class II heme-containing peroxidase [Stygiomarasmius scandens]|uniref:Peroxidase n=1 Tax=Marasmiellus scandens TaxID=2682957 RepID=A0ABR1INI2_9AGAR